MKILIMNYENIYSSIGTNWNCTRRLYGFLHIPDALILGYLSTGMMFCEMLWTTITISDCNSSISSPHR